MTTKVKLILMLLDVLDVTRKMRKAEVKDITTPPITCLGAWT